MHNGEQMQKIELEILCLQKHPEFIDQAIELLNTQWPRSKTARLRSIEQGSSDHLPTSLVLIDKQYGSGKEKVLAHSKVSPVPSNPKMCFIESVVVDPKIRGKGLGRLMMEKTEEFVMGMGITTVYLTTHDQQGFYEKIGYNFCEPIVVFGGRCESLNKIIERNIEIDRPTSIISVPLQSKLMPNTEAINPNTERLRSIENNTPPPLPSLGAMPLPPPPPPPLPIVNQNNNNARNVLTKDSIVVVRNNEIKVTMKKVLL